MYASHRSAVRLPCNCGGSMGTRKHCRPLHSVCLIQPPCREPNPRSKRGKRETVHAPSMRLGGSQKRRSDVRLMSAPTTAVRQMTVVCNGGCIGSVSDKPEGVGAVCAVRRVWGEDVPLAGYGSKGVLLSHARRATGLFLLWARSPMSDAGGGGVWMGVLCKRRQWSGVELAGAARCCG